MTLAELQQRTAELLAEGVDPETPVVFNDYEENDYMHADEARIVTLRTQTLRRYAGDKATRHYEAEQMEKSLGQTYRPSSPEDWGPEWKAVVLE